MGVQTWGQVQLRATNLTEGRGALVTDLVQRFQAIGGEPGTGGHDGLYALCRQRGEEVLGLGLQPFLLAEAGLETLHPLLRLQSKSLG